jgi:hypothetical protein
MDRNALYQTPTAFLSPRAFAMAWVQGQYRVL